MIFLNEELLTLGQSWQVWQECTQHHRPLPPSPPCDCGVQWIWRLHRLDLSGSSRSRLWYSQGHPVPLTHQVDTAKTNSMSTFTCVAVLNFGRTLGSKSCHSLHPSIFLHLFLSQSWWHQVKQGSQDIPLHSFIVQLILVELMTFSWPDVVMIKISTGVFLIWCRVSPQLDT